jgi:hypothetical protein
VKNLSIARRYAKALLLIGKEDGQAETYREELDGVTQAIAGEPELGKRRHQQPALQCCRGPSQVLDGGDSEAQPL